MIYYYSMSLTYKIHNWTLNNKSQLLLSQWSGCEFMYVSCVCRYRGDRIRSAFVSFVRVFFSGCSTLGSQGHRTRPTWAGLFPRCQWMFPKLSMNKESKTSLLSHEWVSTLVTNWAPPQDTLSLLFHLGRANITKPTKWNVFSSTHSWNINHIEPEIIKVLHFGLCLVHLSSQTLYK